MSAPEEKTPSDVWRHVHALTESEQEAIHLLKVQGLSLEEVSRITGASVTAVKQRAHRAYVKLRVALQGQK